MPTSPDVLATALQDLAPGYSELFTQWHPLLEKIVKNGKIDRAVLKGPYREFAVVTDGPGAVTQVLTGSEVITGGRRQNASKGNAYAPRLIYAFDVPGKDLAEANGENDLARIIEHYPELALSDFHERISQQLVMGNGSGVGGFLTLNGDQQYNPDGALRRGMMQFESPTDQVTSAQTVFGLSQGTVSGWTNQYRDITSFAANGRSRMEDVYYTCSAQGAKTMGPVDLLIGDKDSYLNYISDLDAQVRTMKVDGDKAPAQVRQGIPFLEADFYMELDIDPSATAVLTTTEAQDGVIYFLHSKSWNAFTLGHDSGMETKGDFDVRGPIRIPEQDLWRYEYVLHMGLYCDQLRVNGAVTGANTP
jgi:hypothetical protein